MSDGEPTRGIIYDANGLPLDSNSDGDPDLQVQSSLDQDSITRWQAFINDAYDQSYAVELYDGMDATELTHVTSGEDASLVIPVNQMDSTIQSLLQGMDVAEGNVLDNVQLDGTSSMSIERITLNVGGQLQTFDAANAQDVQALSTGVQLSSGAIFTFDFATGQYVYRTNQNNFSGMDEVIQVTATDGSGNSIDYTLNIQLENTLKYSDTFEGLADGNSDMAGWSAGSSNTVIENEALKIEYGDTVTKTFTGFTPGADVKVQMTVDTLGWWEDSGLYQDDLVIRVNGQTLFQQAGEYTGLIELDAQADANGEVNIEIDISSANDSSEDLLVDNILVKEVSPVLTLEGSPLSMDEIIIDYKGGETLVKGFEAELDRLDITGVLDEGVAVDQNSLDQYLSFETVDADNDGQADDTKVTIDSNGSAISGGTQTVVILEDVTLPNNTVDDLDIDFQDK